MTPPRDGIVYETANHYVLAVGPRGFEVYRNGTTAAVKVASVGHGDGPRLGLTRAIAECERREA